MRKEFASLLHSAMSENENIVLLTGDLGYGLWDRIKIDYPDRFYNTLSAEQLMLGTAIGMAMDGKIPVVYSITSFAELAGLAAILFANVFIVADTVGSLFTISGLTVNAVNFVFAQFVNCCSAFCTNNFC
jgi:transketolase